MPESLQLEGVQGCARPCFSMMDHAPSTGLLRKNGLPADLSLLMEEMFEDQEHHPPIKPLLLDEDYCEHVKG